MTDVHDVIEHIQEIKFHADSILAIITDGLPDDAPRCSREHGGCNAKEAENKRYAEAGRQLAKVIAELSKVIADQNSENERLRAFAESVPGYEEPNGLVCVCCGNAVGWEDQEMPTADKPHFSKCLYVRAQTALRGEKP